MKLINKTKNGLIHTISKVKDGKTFTEIISLPVGASAEIPKEVAEKWLKIDGVEKYIKQEDLEKAKKEAEEKAKAELNALKKENEKLKAKIEDLEKAKKEADQ